MTRTMLFYALLGMLLSIEAAAVAGPHAGARFGAHRRHHARAATVAGTPQVARDDGLDVREEKRDECVLGAWKCVGTELQRCYNDQWNFVQNCTGENIICSDALYTTGCVWTWSVENVDVPESASASSPAFTSTSAATSSAPTLTSALTLTSTPEPSSVVSVSASGPESITATPTKADPAAEPSASSASDDDDEDDDCDDENDDGEDQEDYEDDDDDDLEYCDEDEEEAATTSSAAFATPVVTTTNSAESAAPTTSVIGDDDTTDEGDGSADDDYEEGDDEECEDDDEGADVSTTSSPTVTSASASASTSIIGGQLWAGDGDSWDQNTDGDSATASSTGWKHGHGHQHHGWEGQTSSADWDATPTAASSQSTDDGDWWQTSSDTDSPLATSTSTWVDWSDTTATPSAGASSAGWGDDGYGSSVSANASGSGHGHSHSGSETASATASASTSVASGKTNTTTSQPSGSFGDAPHYVVYADEWLYNMPSAAELSSYNRFILAFWMSNQGAVDNAQFWEQLDSSTRAQTIQEYHDAGIALMVSAFGSTDSPTSDGADATYTAQKLAQWVKDYGLDGVDIDYEDMTAMNSARAVSWLVEFQSELRRQLPSPYVITHAPVAPWFTSAPDYADGAYVAIHQQVGDGIDFYNVQFYNQGDDAYTTCKTLLFDSGNDWPSTSVFEINSSAGVPLNKIVIGKPLDEGAASNGFVDASVLNDCVTQAQQKGWKAGVMFWEWTSSAGSIMATVQGTQ